MFMTGSFEIIKFRLSFVAEVPNITSPIMIIPVLPEQFLCLFTHECPHTLLFYTVVLVFLLNRFLQVTMLVKGNA